MSYYLPTSPGSPNYLPSLYSLPTVRTKEDRTENFKQLNVLCKIYLINVSMAKLNLFKCLYHMANLQDIKRSHVTFKLVANMGYLNPATCTEV